MIGFRMGIGLAVALADCGSLASAQTTTGEVTRQGPPGREADARAIVAGERAWGQAYVTGDVATARRLLADDFLGVDPRGRTKDEAAVLSEVREEPHSASDEVGPVTVRFYGDTAIAQAHERQVGPAPGFTPSATVFTDTWVKLGGQWRIVAAEDLDPGPPSAGSPDTAPAAPGGFVAVTPAHIRWTDIPGGHGAQEAELVGGQDKPGFYVVRIRFPPHWMDTPHWHSRDRYITVLQGTWTVGTGPLFDPAKATPLGPGSVMKHPAHGVHWDGSAGDEAVIVQIVGIGPVSTTQVDPKGPEWVHVAGPAPP